MSRMIDLTGQRYGRLVVRERVQQHMKGQARWLCLCDCGNTTVVQSYDLRSGNTQSCGCQRRVNFKHKIHGHSQKRIYAIWKGMKSRCSNPNRKCYSDYGGKGIKVCSEWEEDFQAFYNWAIENGYNDELTIDRIDPDGNYEPSNCRWADNLMQGNNKTDNIYVECEGETHTISEWSRITGIKYGTLYNRIVNLMWEPKKALNKK
jgi:hypothetical protein